MVVDLFGGDEGEALELGGFEVGFFEVDGGDLVVIVASVVINTVLEVAAGRVNRDVIAVIAEVDDAALIIDRVENVEELGDRGEIGGIVRGLHDGVEFGEGGFDKTAAAREIAGEADGAHAARIRF